MICHTEGCPASLEHDEFERRTSVQIDNRTQCSLGPTGHHLINRVFDGTIETHIAGWKDYQLTMAFEEIQAERRRVEQYQEALDTLTKTLADAYVTR